MLETSSLPPPANKENIQKFCANFHTLDKFEQYAQDSNSAELITKQDIQTLKDARGRRIKVGQNLIHIDSSYIAQIHATLAKLGIRCWGPDLEEDAGSLFNSACRFAAITTFQQLTIACGYDFMNWNSKYLEDVLLLNQAYNHYAHHFLAARFKAEKAKPGRYVETIQLKAANGNWNQVSGCFWRWCWCLCACGLMVSFV